jgi:hypothetical protein
MVMRSLIRAVYRFRDATLVEEKKDDFGSPLQNLYLQKSRWAARLPRTSRGRQTLQGSNTDQRHKSTLILSCVPDNLLCVSYSPCPNPNFISANEAAAHVGEYATVEGVVAKLFTSKAGNTFLNIGAAYPNQTFTGWIPPASPVSKSAVLSDIEGKHVRIIGRIEMYKGKPEVRINAASQLIMIC